MIEIAVPRPISLHRRFWDEKGGLIAERAASETMTAKEVRVAALPMAGIMAAPPISRTLSRNGESHSAESDTDILFGDSGIDRTCDDKVQSVR